MNLFPTLPWRSPRCGPERHPDSVVAELVESAMRTSREKHPKGVLGRPGQRRRDSAVAELAVGTNQANHVLWAKAERTPRPPGCCPLLGACFLWLGGAIVVVKLLGRR